MPRGGRNRIAASQRPAHLQPHGFARLKSDRLLDGQLHERQLDIAPGYPGNQLSEAQHLARFDDCMAYAALPLPGAQVTSLLDKLARLAALADATVLLDDLVCAGA